MAVAGVAAGVAEQVVQIGSLTGVLGEVVGVAGLVVTGGDDVTGVSGGNVQLGR